MNKEKIRNIVIFAIALIVGFLFYLYVERGLIGKAVLLIVILIILLKLLLNIIIKIFK